MKIYKAYTTAEKVLDGLDKRGRRKYKRVETQHRVEIKSSEVIRSYMSERDHLEDKLEGCLNLIKLLLLKDSKETVLKNIAEEMDKGWFTMRAK